MHSPRQSPRSSPRANTSAPASSKGGKGNDFLAAMKQRKKAAGAVGNIQLQDERLQMESEDLAAKEMRFKEQVSSISL
jgi:hypothetical protein